MILLVVAESVVVDKLEPDIDIAAVADLLSFEQEG